MKHDENCSWTQRQRISPANHNNWSILVDVCRCGYAVAVNSDKLTNKQLKWLGNRNFQRQKLKKELHDKVKGLPKVSINSAGTEFVISSTSVY